MDARARYLMQREADGELTPVEARELARRRAGSLEAQRDAAAWQRVEAGLRAALDRAPPLAIDRIASRVERRVARQQTRRPLVAAASVVVLGCLALSQLTAPPVEVMSQPLAQVVMPAPPVEVHVDASGESAGLVRIEF